MTEPVTQFFRSSNGKNVPFHQIHGAHPTLIAVGGYVGSSLTAKPLGKRILSYAAHSGLAAVIMDLPGQEQEGYEWARNSVADFATYIMELAEIVRARSCIGIGASLGGWATLLAQQRNNALFSNALLLAPAVNWDIEYFKMRIATGGLTRKMLADGSIFFRSAEHNIDVFEAFLTSCDAARVSRFQLKFSGTLRILQGTADEIVRLDSTRNLVKSLAASTSVSMRVVEAAGHELSTLENPAHAQLFTEELTKLVAGARHKDV